MAAHLENAELATMASKEPLFPRIDSTKAVAATKNKKKPELLMKSLSFLMDDAPETQASHNETQIDYEKLKITIRDRIVDALSKHLESQHQLTDEKRNEIDALIKYPKQHHWHPMPISVMLA